MEYKKIEIGSHAGDYLVEINGVKKILTYADILELQAKEEAHPEVVQEIDKITFPSSNIEPTVVGVEEEETPKKKKSRKKSEFR